MKQPYNQNAQPQQWSVQLQQQEKLHPSSPQETEAMNNLKRMILQNYGSNALSIAEYFNPDFLTTSSIPKEECYWGDYPTLSQLREDFPVALMMIHLHDLSEYCGSKDKLTGRSRHQCACIIATEFDDLKITELILFFHRFKSGYYDRFYGSVDPLIITSSLRDFLMERINVIERREKEEMSKKREEWKRNAVTWEAYAKMRNGIISPSPLDREIQRPQKEKPKETKEGILCHARIIAEEQHEGAKAALEECFRKKYGFGSQEYIQQYEKEKS